MRRRIDPPLDRLGRRMADAGLSANLVTLGGFVLGLAALPLLAMGEMSAALIFILLNRLSDGLDGAIARHGGASDLGGYLDIVCDFLFYAAIPFGFALAEPAANALPAAFLIFSFVATGSSFLAYAVFAAKRGITTADRGSKGLYYLGGLTEGTETILLFVAICLWPAIFPWAAWIFGGLCWLTAASRMAEAWRSFGSS